MKPIASGIVADGPLRLRAAIAEKVWREHEAELEATTDYWKKAALMEKIEKEIKKRIKQSGSSGYALWSC